MSELKPCPFCGGEDSVMKLTSEDGFTSIGCLNDHSFFGIMVQGNTEAEAIEAWNTRHERTCRMTRVMERYDAYSAEYEITWACSECGRLSHGVTKSNYCPKCGAKVIE
jgi:RNA polymerase subunit RPABC4/transcription elongation factor Spt4